MQRFFAGVLAAGILVAPTVRGAETTTQVLMRDKLEAAHGVLDGLALGDFQKIAHHADMLRKISRATTWHQSNSEEFLYYAKNFQNASDALLDGAKSKDLEA